jgi:hypothetical protein
MICVMDMQNKIVLSDVHTPGYLLSGQHSILCLIFCMLFDIARILEFMIVITQGKREFPYCKF